jgi:protein-L-isoaspartate(D-aspartate) O-methyltransferase
MSGESLVRARAAFADDIRNKASIKSALLIEGLATVPRENFMGPGPWRIMRPAEMANGYRTTADENPRHLYENVLVALDETRRLNNGEPSALLLWLDTLALSPGDRFMHIGCGVGYYTAIAAHAVGPQGSVVAVEIDCPLAARAERNLAPYRNVKVVKGDGSKGTFGSFDAIFVNAGCTRPQPSWLDQLAMGGRLLFPLTVALPTPGAGAGYMLLVTRNEAGYDARLTSPVGIFDCEGARTEEESAQLAKAFAQGDLQAIRRLRRDPHETSQDCWLHQSGICVEYDSTLRSSERRPVEIASELLGSYAGQYQLTPDLVLTITRRGDRLFAQFAERPDIEIYPESDRQFFYKVMNAQITFVIDGDGFATGLIFHHGGRASSARRIR